MTSLVLAPSNLLLDQSRREDPSLDYVLLLTFNHDLAFFEREALGLLQLTGARIGIVGDAAVTRPDIYAVRRAGSSYLAGLASCTASFHPKLIAMVGRDHATVSIGSGNLSLGGWRGNDELWSVHQVSTDAGSTVPAQVGGFLERLAVDIRMAAEVRDFVGRTAKALQRHTGDETTGTVVSSLSGPIIDQLPHGPVDELLLYAPFHDQGATAVSRLVERFQPDRLTIAYQPETTLAEGAKLERLVLGRGELVALEDKPYRHGKLIEWSCNGRRWALTGSANLSSAALLRDARSGNVELGVIAEIPATLLPKARLDTPIIARPPTWRGNSDRPAAADLILAAVRKAGGTHVTLARPLSRDGSVEFSEIDEPPERWREVAAAPIGATEIEVAIDVAGGTRVRVAFGGAPPTPVVFVADLESILKPRPRRGLGPPTPEIEDVLVDPEAAERFWTLVEGLRVATKAPRRAPAAAGQSTAGRRTAAEDWTAYLERCRDQLSGRLAAFAFGHPLAPTERRSSNDHIDWDDEGPTRDEVGSLDSDTDETDESEIERDLGAFDRIARERLADASRARYRTFARRLVRHAADAEPHENLIALRLLLLLAACEVWGPSDLSWAELALTVIEALADCQSAELEAAAGSLAATSLAVVDHALLIRAAPANRSQFRRTSKSIAHLLVAAEAERVDEYRRGLARFRAAVTTSDVMRLADRLVLDDPFDRVLTALEDNSIEFVPRGRVIELTHRASSPLELARSVQRLLPSNIVAAIRARGTQPGRWAVVVASETDEIDIWSGPAPGSALVNHTRKIGSHRQKLAETAANQPVPSETVEVLAAFGLGIADLHSSAG